MTAKKVAHEIVLDAQKHEIRIDGIVFPYYVMEGPEVLSIGDMALGAVQIGIFANNITVIGSDGGVSSVVKASLGAELEWARRRATEIVVERLATVLEQLGKEEA